MAPTRLPSATKVWTMIKLNAALRDLPEIIPLGVLLVGALSMGVYTIRRNYLGLPGEAFPDKHMRQSWERQVSYGQEHIPPSVFWRVAQWRRDPKDGSIDVAVFPFSNRAFKGEHELPLSQGPQHVGIPVEGPAPTEY